MPKPVIYTVSIKLARKDGKPISPRSKMGKTVRELKQQFIAAGFEVEEVESTINVADRNKA